MRVTRDPSFDKRSLLMTALALSLAACGEPADAGEPVPPGPDSERVAPGCVRAGPLAAPDAPAIAAPAGTELYLRLRAEGTQVYTCGNDGTSGWRWTLKAPDARLIDDRCTEVGTHFAGPSWKIERDGSTFVGRKSAEMPARNGGSVPWLLIEAVSTSGNGMLTGASHVQRVDTVGGVAPASACGPTKDGVEQPVPYTATYLCYRRATSGQGPTY